MNRFLAWLVSLPLAAAGMLTAHELGWRSSSAQHVSPHGHYLEYAAILAALAAAVLITVTWARLLRGVAGTSLTSLGSARVFAVVPLVGFVVQEHLEHLVAGRELDPAFFVSTPFLVGLALQVPFALAALAVARILLSLVNAAARALGGSTTDAFGRARHARVPCGVLLPARPILATRHAGRAPPRRPR